MSAVPLYLQGSGRSLTEAKHFMEEFLAMRGMMKKMSTMAASQGKGDDPTQVARPPSNPQEGSVEGFGLRISGISSC